MHVMAEADCARNVVSMGQIFCNFKAPHGGFSLRHFDDFVKLLENLPGCHTHMHCFEAIAVFLHKWDHGEILHTGPAICTGLFTNLA